MMLFFALCLAVAFAAYALEITLCPFRRLTGLPCPCCGATRACLSVLRGDFAVAVRLNPLAVVTIFVVPFLVVAMTLLKVRTRVVVINAMKVFACLAILANWAYLLCCSLGWGN